MSTDDSSELYYGSSFEESDGDEEMDQKEDKSKRKSKWSELPPLALEKIYLLLNRDDQMQMALVCRKWFQEYSSPRVWRNIRFVLPEQEYPSEICPEVHFARKYGNMFHDVVIDCKRVHLNLLGIIWKQLKLFLAALTHHSLNFSEFKSLSFINMSMYFRHLDDIIYKDVFQGILDLFLAQNKLISIEFRNSQFERNDAAQLLKAICVQNVHTLKVLKLEDFVKESSQDDFLENEIAAYTSNNILINLREIVVDYTQLFESITMECSELDNAACYQQKKGFLEKMKILCYGSRRVGYRGIQPDVWKKITKKCPLLKIEFSYYAGSQTRNTLDTFLISNMPIRSLSFTGSHRESRNRIENEFGPFFHYLLTCEVNLFLEELNIIWTQSSADFAGNLIYFLQACSKLKVLQLCIHHPVQQLELVFDFWLQKGPMSLSLVHLTIVDVEDTDESDVYINLADDFAPLLQVLGLHLILIVDLVFIPPRRQVEQQIN